MNHHHSRVHLTLEGAIAPKARPRFDSRSNRAHMPQKYLDWKAAAIWDIRSQYQGEPLEGVAVAVELSGKHSRRADADNVAGAILDALVQAGVLRDDSLMCVPQLAIALNHGKQAATTQIVITDYIHH